MDHKLTSLEIDVPPIVDPRRTRSRKAMLAAMLDLLAEKRFEDVQITDLTQRAGVGYATFFRHFADTRAVLGEVAGSEIAELLAMTMPVIGKDGRLEAETATSTSTRELCRYVDDRRALWHTLLTGGARDTVRAEFVRQARDWASRYPVEGARVPIDLGTVCCAGSTIDALAWWLEHGREYSPEQFSELIDLLVIRPFLAAR